MGCKPRRILVVYEQPHTVPCRETMRAHLRVFETSPTRHEVEYFNAHEALPSDSARRKNPVSRQCEIPTQSFDVVLFHYSLLGMRALGHNFYHWKQNFSWLADLSGLKIAVPQDEGDYAAILDEWLEELGVTVIFSVHYGPEGPLYPIMRSKATIYPCLPGYIDDEQAIRIRDSLVPIADRPMDIAYRARKLPLRYGRAGRMKSLLAEVIAEHASQRGFTTDVSTGEADTITGSHWLDFLASTRIVPGAEGGYSAIDWRGELRAQCNALLRAEPGLTFDKFSRRLPDGWDDYQLLTITPRHLEAIITKSCQVLVEGDYKGVLEPHEHFIPLRHDFSNLAEVLETIRDHGYLQEIADRAYEDICKSNRYTYRTWASQLDEIIEQHDSAEHRKHQRMSQSNTDQAAIEALERQLIAARQENARIQAQLQEMAEEIAERTADQVVPRLVQGFRKSIVSLLPLAVAVLALLFAALAMLIVWLR